MHIQQLILSYELPTEAIHKELRTDACLSRGGGATMWTRRLMRTAFILIVAITTLTPELDADIGTWIQLDDGMAMGRIHALEAGENRLYAGASNGILSRKTMGAPGTRPCLKKPLLQLQSMGKRCMPEHGQKVCFGRMMPG